MFDKPVDVVRWFGAIQAQEYLHSLWAVGLRTTKAVAADVEDALANRSIVRTWPMRGTIHYVPAEDVRWILELLAPKVIRQNQSILRKAGLDEQVLAQSRKILTNLLSEQSLTRDELYTALENGGISARQKTAVGSPGLHIIVYWAMMGLICFGARRGKQPTYVLLDNWVADHRQCHRDEALAELAIRYFRSHAPATEYDFAWWAGLTLGDARLAIELAKPHLTHEIIGEQSYWFATLSPGPKESADDACLLPLLDEYTVAYQDRRCIADPRFVARNDMAQPGVLLNPVVLFGGRVIGTWQRAFKSNKVVIESNLVTPLHDVERHAIAVAQQRFANFVGLPLASKSGAL